MELSDLVNAFDTRRPFDVRILEGQMIFGDPELVHPGVLFGLIQAAPRSWWWSGSQMTRLQPKGQPRHEVHIFLCKSGRFAVSYGENVKDGGYWRLTEPEMLQQGRNAETDWSTCGGESIEVPGAVTVRRETAWKAIGGMYLCGGRDPSLNWKPHQELEHLFDEDIGFP